MKVNPTVTTALAFRQAILLVKNENFNNVIIEREIKNALQVVQAIKKKSQLFCWDLGKII